MTDGPLLLGQGLFGRLRRDAGAVWDGYVAHDFVRALGRGTLPEAAFRHFLVQDYLFLIHFARAHALAGFKATQLADIRAAAKANGMLELREDGLRKILDGSTTPEEVMRVVFTAGSD